MRKQEDIKIHQRGEHSLALAFMFGGGSFIPFFFVVQIRLSLRVRKRTN